MQEIYLVNYCNTNCSPLKSITRLSKPEAFALAKNLSDQYSGTAFGRLIDFDNYYPRRIQTEQWLYNCFLELGGKPATRHPLYFVLQGSDFLDQWFGKGIVTKLPLSNISSKHVSFTFGDSMAKYDKPERRDPFLKETLLELIDPYHGDVNLFLSSISEQYTYIEVQLWNDKYCKQL